MLEFRKFLKNHSGGSRGSGAARSRPECESRILSLYASEIEPGLALAATRKIRPADARAPHDSDSFRVASSEIAEIFEIWLKLEISGIPEIPQGL